MTGHFDLVSKSFKALAKNTGTIVLWIVISILLAVVVGGSAVTPAIFLFIIGNLGYEVAFIFAVPFAVLAAIVILGGLFYLAAASYGMIADISILGKSSLDRIFSHGKTHFFNLAIYSGAVLCIVLFSLLLLGMPTLLVFFLVSKTAGIVMGILLSLLWFLFILIFWVLTVFGIPILIIKKKRGFAALSESIRYSIKNPDHVFLTAAVLFVIWLISAVIERLLNIPADSIDFLGRLNPLYSPSLWFLLVSLLLSFLSLIVAVVTSLVRDIYVFKSYLSKNPVKIKTNRKSF